MTSVAAALGDLAKSAIAPSCLPFDAIQFSGDGNSRRLIFVRAFPGKAGPGGANAMTASPSK